MGAVSLRCFISGEIMEKQVLWKWKHEQLLSWCTEAHLTLLSASLEAITWMLPLFFFCICIKKYIFIMTGRGVVQSLMEEVSALNTESVLKLWFFSRHRCWGAFPKRFCSFPCTYGHFRVSVPFLPSGVLWLWFSDCGGWIISQIKPVNIWINSREKYLAHKKAAPCLLHKDSILFCSLHSAVVVALCHIGTKGSIKHLFG